MATRAGIIVVFCLLCLLRVAESYRHNELGVVKPNEDTQEDDDDIYNAYKEAAEYNAAYEEEYDDSDYWDNLDDGSGYDYYDEQTDVEDIREYEYYTHYLNEMKGGLVATCDDPVVEVGEAESEFECQFRCLDHPECAYADYYEDTKECKMTHMCFADADYEDGECGPTCQWWMSLVCQIYPPMCENTEP